MFLIKRTDQGGGYVAPSGSHKSYTTKRAALFFNTYEEAEAHGVCAGNEIIIEVDINQVLNIKSQY